MELPSTNENQQGTPCCLICTKTASTTETLNYSAKIAIILKNLFEVLCKSMKWKPPSKYQFNFIRDPFPFCNECKLSLVQLYKLHEQMDDISKKINQLRVKICSKILESQRMNQVLIGNDCAANLKKIGPVKRLTKALRIEKKCTFYRDLVYERFMPVVLLPMEPKKVVGPQRKVIRRKPDPRKTALLKVRNRFRTRANATLPKNGVARLPALIDLTLEEGTAVASKSKRPKAAIGFKSLGDTRSQNSIGNSNGHELIKMSNGIKTEPGAVGTFTVSMTSENRETMINCLRQYKYQLYTEAKSQEANNFTVLYDGKYYFGHRSDDDQWGCIFCKEAFARMPHLICHLNVCPGRPPPPDAIKTSKYKRYTYDELTNGEFQCRHCTYLSSKLEIIEHLEGFHVGLSNSNSFAYKSAKLFAKQEKLMEHKSLNGRLFSCDSCKKSFKYKRVLKRHKREVHVKRFPVKTLKTFRCKICGKMCGNLGALVTHRKIHTNTTGCRTNNKKTCQICQKDFSSKLLLYKHQLVHTGNQGNRPFSCNFCGKSFKSKYAMRMHIAWNHLRNSDKKFACEVCGETFERLLLLTLHDKVHEKVKVKKCFDDHANSTS